jgi:hypothetical protein
VEKETTNESILAKKTNFHGVVVQRAQRSRRKAMEKSKNTSEGTDEHR